MGWPSWEQATRCSGSATPGAQALMRWIIENYGNKGAQNWGIYNCRDVVGGSTTSTHGEGRALDVGFPVGDPDGDRLLRRLRRAPGRLGIQAIIYERRIYSAKHPTGGYYAGEAPHYDHLHIELTREAGRKLTYATVKRVLTPKSHKAGSRNLSKGDRGADVRWVQRKLGITADGVYGDKTVEAVRRWERSKKSRFKKMRVDGVIRKITWRSFGVKPTY